MILTNLATTIALVINLISPIATPKPEVLGERQFSLENRYAVQSVNEVMKKNILLNLAYLNGNITQKTDINWGHVTSPFHFQKTLEKGDTFAYHEIVKGEYANKIAFTTNAHFNASDGFLSDGYLYGDGVCHLASLINWTAADAGLKTEVPKDHRSVGPIPNVPDEYGVSIYMNLVSKVGANNNLYVTNTKDYPVTFHFEYDGENVKVYITRV